MSSTLWGAAELHAPRVFDERLQEIQRQDAALQRRFQARLKNDCALSRAVVSFGASKIEPKYRWFKFREAFSPTLVKNKLAALETRGRVLDPFSGSGTTLFAAAELGWDATGIEVLPVGCFLVQGRKIAESLLPAEFDRLRFWRCEKPWNTTQLRAGLVEMRITQGAYAEDTKNAIESYLGALVGESERVAFVLRMALASVLEAVSYTRKDGQYLRWDTRSGRKQGARPFHKGPILPFDTAIGDKLDEITRDCHAQTSQLTLLATEPELARYKGGIEVLAGSSLELLPQFPRESFDAIVTSPPYCNRYDYTRTYALELALLGVSGEELIALRQEMLSCTVENRAKDLLSLNAAWDAPLRAVADCELLQTILNYLDEERAAGRLNNTGIARMVRGYFQEMACIISECARVLKPSAPLWMVNDNVRYAGASISVDLILSCIAEMLGFEVEAIAVAPGGKGNSSQQMGTHGRESLRKCVYAWRKR